MALLAGWAATWILIHRLISGGPLRSWLVACIGERPYRMTFGLSSLACLAGLANAYANVKPIGTAAAPWLAGIVAIIQLFATTLVTPGFQRVIPRLRGWGKRSTSRTLCMEWLG